MYIKFGSIDFHTLFLGGINYRIAPNFRDAQFSMISVFRNFAETIFVDQGFL